MKTAQAFLFFLLCISFLQAQPFKPFLGTWLHESGDDLIEKIEIKVDKAINSNRPIVYVYLKGGKNLGRNLASFKEGAVDELNVVLKGSSRSYDFTFAINPKSKLLMSKLTMTSLSNNKSVKKGSSYRKKALSKVGPIKAVPSSNGKKPKPKRDTEPSTKPKIEGMVIAKPISKKKAKLIVKLPSCSKCNQYTVLIRGNGELFSINPDGRGNAVFTNLPYGSYTISVSWKGKMDMPGTPPYKVKKVVIDDKLGGSLSLSRK